MNQNKIITVIKVLTRLMFIRKASNAICTRLNAESESKDFIARMINSMKVAMKIGKSSEQNTRIRRDISSNTIM